VIILLGGCGGGGGGSTTAAPMAPAPMAQSYPLQSAFANYVTRGYSTNFSVSGNCTGSATLVGSATTPGTFQSASALVGTQSIVFTACPALNATRTLYYDGQDSQIGFSISGGELGVARAPLAMPKSVVVGDTGTLGTFDTWSDSTKTTPTGTLVVTYEVLPDTSTTVLVDLIKKSYNVSAVLIETDEYRYRISPSGAFTPASFDYVTASILITAN
jgi:hypothetical protein